MEENLRILTCFFTIQTYFEKKVIFYLETLGVNHNVCMRRVHYCFSSQVHKYKGSSQLRQKRWKICFLMKIFLISRNPISFTRQPQNMFFENLIVIY